MKIEGSGSGSISLRHGSADPDPHQNVMDPEHCLATLASFYIGAGSAGETDRSVDSSRMGQPETRHHAQRRKMATPTEFEVAAWGQSALTKDSQQLLGGKPTEICEGTRQ
jgi:hypothetical protein